MIVIQSNITSTSLLATLKDLMHPFPLHFIPIQEEYDLTASNHPPIYVLNNPEPQLLKQTLPGAIIICLNIDQSSIKASEERAIFFLEKPFRVESLITLLKKVVKNSIQFGPFILDYEARLLRNIHQNKAINLTEKEASLLLNLFQKQGQEISRSDLLFQVWGYKSDLETQTLETHLYRLKKKLIENFETQLILTNKENYFLSEKEW